MECLRRLLFIFLLLLFCALPVFSQDYILVPKNQMIELNRLSNLLLSQIELVESELLKTQNELNLLGISNNQLLKELETQKQLQKESEKLQKGLLMKTSFLVGGVCVVVGVGLGIGITALIVDKLK